MAKHNATTVPLTSYAVAFMFLTLDAVAMKLAAETLRQQADGLDAVADLILGNTNRSTARWN